MIHADGLTGLLRALRGKLTTLSQDPSADVSGVAPMFRYATCNDLIQLKARYPGYCFPERDASASNAWGLKAMGRLFCVDKILQLRPKKILEVGGGSTTFFDEHFGTATEYWMIDNGAFDPWNRFNEVLKKRQNTHFVRGLLGEFKSELPDSYFDLVFSVSVLEHVPTERKGDVYRDMFRILGPGGFIVHSIDIPKQDKGRLEFKHISDAGFTLPSRPDLWLNVRSHRGQVTLFEPLHLVFTGYFGIGRKDMWTNLRSVTQHYPTILALGIKPQAQQPVAGGRH
jgi:SAM-dependent methyltransferase